MVLMGNFCPKSYQPRLLNDPLSPAANRIKVLSSQLHSDAIFDVASTDESNTFLSCSNDQTIVRFNWQQNVILDKWLGHSSCVNKVEE
jgi:hypothetical protein